MLSLPIGCLLYQVRPDGFFIACKYTGPLLIISEGLLNMNKRKISTGHREHPVLNILGFCRRGLAFSPCPDVLVTPSLKVINSIPLLSFTKQKSSIFISWCCWRPRNPKCWINNQKTVFVKDSGVKVPSCPHSHKISSSSAFRLWARWRLFPLPSERSFLAFFSSLTFFRHSHDLKIMFLSLLQIEAIAEESSPLVQIGLRKVRF